MDFYGIDMQGYFKAQTIVDASALVWEPDDESRLIYDEVTEDLWIADDTEWVNASKYVDTPLGTEMWFYSNAAPDGWSIVTAGDELLAVKGGSYAVGGTVDGDWATPNHSHSMQSHWHGIPGGVTQNSTGINRSRRSGGDEVLATHTHTFPTVNSSGPSTPSTQVDGTSSVYRPESRVGLICERV